MQELTWVRPKDRMIAGVCSGMAKKFNKDPWLIRFIWMAMVLLFGTGVLAYIVLAFALPREDQPGEHRSKRILGVCLRISQHTGIEVGLVRALTLFAAVLSFGTVSLAYFVLSFVLSEPEVQYLPSQDPIVIDGRHKHLVVRQEAR